MDGNNYLYKELWFEIKNLNGVNEFNVYVTRIDEASKNYSLHYVLNADFSELYNYLSDNF